MTAVFGLSHIDRMPLGDISSTIHTLIVFNEKIDFVYTYGYDGRSFTLDTREMRAILGTDVSLPDRKYHRLSGNIWRRTKRRRTAERIYENNII